MLTVDFVDIVYIVDTVNIVDTDDIVDTVDIVDIVNTADVIYTNWCNPKNLTHLIIPRYGSKRCYPILLFDVFEETGIIKTQVLTFAQFDWGWLISGVLEGVFLIVFLFVLVFVLVFTIVFAFAFVFWLLDFEFVLLYQKCQWILWLFTMDSVVIYNGFCGNSPRILWL